MNIWHNIRPSKVKPDNFSAVIEISKGGKQKYELDNDTGFLRLDRILYTSTHYPANYGFIPRTIADDNDPLDVLVLCSEPIHPMTIVDCYPIGMIAMTDRDERDDKILAIPFKDPQMNIYKDISEIPQHQFDEIAHFFSVYKQLENKMTSVEEILDHKAAMEVIAVCIDRYIKKYG